MSRVTAAILATIIVLSAAVVVIVLLASGYQFDFHKNELTATGILVATSDPDGATVTLNGKLQTATNNSINLTPGKYDIKIAKDGFTPWEKTVEIKKGEVFKTNVFLFPNLPDLRPLTLTGANIPSLSPDGTKIAYSIASTSAEKNGVWIMDMARPLGGPDFHQIYRGNLLSEANFLWDSESKQILASASSQVSYLLSIDQINSQLTPVYDTTTTDLLSQWQIAADTKLDTQKTKLPPAIAATLATTSASLQFSPDESKIMYVATASAYLPSYLTIPLPGSDPTPQRRDIKPNNLYIYDLKEDRNYLIENCPAAAGSRSGGDKLQISNCVWFPSSRHLLAFTNNEIAVMEYDGTNKSVVYAGPFVPGVVYAWPNWSKIVILTSLGSPGSQENLYTINLR